MELLGVVFLAVLAHVSALPRDPVFPEIYNEGVLGSRQGSRIVSGWEAAEGQFPHQLSMRMVATTGAVNACGGTIIHEEWGMTAAHCTAARVTMVIRAGTVNLTTPALIFETTEYYNHPEYNANIPSVVQPHDIALLKFGLKLEFNSRLSPIRLQPSVHENRDYTEEVLTASGWGVTWSSGSSPENMNWVYLRGVSNDICRWWYNYSPIIVDSTICAQYYNVTSQSTCQGDSGGPLTVYDVDGGLTQVGISSFVSGLGCHTENPAGFIRPGHYHKWIKQITGQDLDWDPEAAPPTESESEESESEEETTEVSETTTTLEPESESQEETTQVSETTTTPEPESESQEETTKVSETTPEPESESESEEENPETAQPSTTTEAPQTSSPEESNEESENSDDQSENSDSNSSDDEDSDLIQKSSFQFQKYFFGRFW